MSGTLDPRRGGHHDQLDISETWVATGVPGSEGGWGAAPEALAEWMVSFPVCCNKL